MISLLDPIQIGEIHLPNRVIMSPLTRLRGTPEHIPTQLMAEYYAQRAGAGLIVRRSGEDGHRCFFRLMKLPKLREGLRANQRHVAR